MLMKLEGGFFLDSSDSKYYRRDYKSGALVESTQEAYSAWLSKSRITHSIEWAEWDGDLPAHLYLSKNTKYYWFVEERMISLIRENDSSSNDIIGFEGSRFVFSVVKDLENLSKLIGHKQCLLALKLLDIDLKWIDKSVDLLGIWQSSPELINYDGENYDFSVMIDEYGEKFCSIKKLRFGAVKKSPLAIKAIEVEDEDIF